MRAARDDSDCFRAFAGRKNGRALARDSAFDEQPDETPPVRVGRRTNERRVAYHAGPIGFDGPAETDLERADVGAKLVSVQRQAGFDAKRVTRAEPAAAQSFGSALLEQQTPQAGRRIPRTEHLETVFA